LNREADQKVRESEERYRTVIESSNDGVAITKKGKHIYVNPRYLEIFGFEKPEDIIGKSISCTVHPDDYKKILSNVKLNSAGKKSIRNEFKGIKKMEPLFLF